MECRAGKLGAARDAGNWPNPTQTHSFHGRNNHSVCGWVGMCVYRSTCGVGDRGEEPGSQMGYMGGREEMGRRTGAGKAGRAGQHRETFP